MLTTALMAGRIYVTYRWVSDRATTTTIPNVERERDKVKHSTII